MCVSQNLGRTVRFDGCWRRRRRRSCGTGVDHLQVPGFLLAWIFSKHPLSDRNLAGPLVGTAGRRQNHEKMLETSGQHLDTAGCLSVLAEEDKKPWTAWFC